MGLKRRVLVRGMVAVLALLVVAAAVDGVRLLRAARLNALIGAGALPAATPQDAPELRFAQAHALALRGEVDEALGRYGALQDDRRLGPAARYNGANLLLRQAQALHDAQRRGQVLAWVELAKEGYRELLRRHPEDWPARYNLERAQRLLPDPQDADEDPAAPRRGAERAATTMRGYSPGLP
jgi:mxaK protein